MVGVERADSAARYTRRLRGGDDSNAVASSDQHATWRLRGGGDSAMAASDQYVDVCAAAGGGGESGIAERGEDAGAARRVGSAPRDA